MKPLRSRGCVVFTQSVEPEKTAQLPKNSKTAKKYWQSPFQKTKEAFGNLTTNLMKNPAPISIRELAQNRIGLDSPATSFELRHTIRML